MSKKMQKIVCNNIAGFPHGAIYLAYILSGSAFLGAIITQFAYASDNQHTKLYLVLLLVTLSLSLLLLGVIMLRYWRSSIDRVEAFRWLSSASEKDLRQHDDKLEVSQGYWLLELQKAENSYRANQTPAEFRKYESQKQYSRNNLRHLRVQRRVTRALIRYRKRHP